jgi:dTDP-4-dehydrorhamnose reductase
VRLAIIGDGLLGHTLWGTALLTGGAGIDMGLFLLTHEDIDITSESSIRAALMQYRPDVVINTAALHTLAACEDDPRRAFDVNARAAERLAKLVPTVYISTDYVFTDGGPHDESMPGQQPRSVYGRSKLAGELATLEHGGIVVRVSSLYGHYTSRAKGNKGFPDAFLSSSDSIKLPTDQTFSPTYAPDAAERMLMLSAALMHTGRPQGVYHAANRGWTTWAEFAEHIIALTQHKRHVIPFAAKDDLRPRNSSLKSTRLPGLRHWAPALSTWAQREGRMTIVSPRRGDA